MMACSRAADVGVDGVEAAAVCRLVFTLDIVSISSNSYLLNYVLLNGNVVWTVDSVLVSPREMVYVEV